MDHSIGRHTVHEDGDIVYIKFVGGCPLGDMEAVIKIIDDVIRRYGRFGACADVTELGTVPPEARRYAGTWKGVDHCFGTAIYGASALNRILIALISRAIELFLRRRPRSELAFFKTSGEARDWLLAQRARRTSA